MGAEHGIALCRLFCVCFSVLIKGLRVNEWVILGLKARQTGGLRRTFALRLGSEFAMNIGWHEH